MVVEFLKEFTKLIIDNKDGIHIEKVDIDDTFSEVSIFVDKAEIGKIIGKDGKMINAIKTVLAACKAKNGKSYRITVKTNEER